MAVLKQPIVGRDSGYVCILRPSGFYWTGRKLYVGYAWLSKLHPDEMPVWDKDPVKPWSVIESMPGQHYSVEQASAAYLGKRATREKTMTIHRKTAYIPEEVFDLKRRPKNLIPNTVRETFTLVPGQMLRTWFGEFAKIEHTDGAFMKEARSFRAARGDCKYRTELENIGGYQIDNVWQWGGNG